MDWICGCVAAYSGGPSGGSGSGRNGGSVAAALRSCSINRVSIRAHLTRISSSIAAVEFSGACVATAARGMIRDSVLTIS